MKELPEFLSFLLQYTKSRLLTWGQGFEKLKSFIVAVLIAKRGKYSLSFLNTSFFLLVVTAMVGGPIIAENNPFTNSSDEGEVASAATLSYNPYESSLSTVISAKPRDGIVKYEVRGGDTLSSIATKFDISSESIRWANDLSSDALIKPGQELDIPPVTGIVHKVQSGESIYTIAKKYRTDAQKIVNFPFNDFADLDTFSLRAGQTLYVPDGSPPEAPKPVYEAPVYAQVQPGVRGSSNFIYPTSGSVSQYPVWYHMAVDIQNPGAPGIIASDGGSVVFSGCVAYGYGCHVIIDHGNGYRTLYAHLSSLGVSAGQTVGQGQSLGVMGCTGRCTGTHLHFEVIQGGVQQNPLSFLQ